ncbi:NAD(P)/FAD-dependent oxidoreductase [Nocardioides sp.]|uniref:flavin-containing monooxygenase n=1 Tax=Nocardioides sp. TaxID=35761 RepID=UPI002A00B752|nr:monooxygenase [Nocardioides sp.]MCW2795709.1 monooxygenase [Nocardioides sp.]
MADHDNEVDLHDYPATQSAEPTGPLDLDYLRDKYRQERDKRLRAQGTNQYNFAEGDLAKYDDDPYAPPAQPREPQTEELDVLIIGGGFGGLLAGAAMRKANVPSLRILDVASDFGGTWYWNRYPGVRCDVEAYIYLPFLEETGYMPTERYTAGPEILEYTHLLGRHFDLYQDALFQTRVTGMDWDEEASRWNVTTDRGDRFAARFVTTQSGIFSRPQLPGVPGIETFKGTSFHTARWNYEFTGGDGQGGALDKLSDKRVAVIGTGSTALQAIPQLAASAQHLTVFQRTPTAVGVRDNAPTDVEWFKSLPSGWQQQRMDSFQMLADGTYTDDCPVDDGWTRYWKHTLSAVGAIPEAEMSPERYGAEMEKADYAWNEMIRARVDAVVKDEQKARDLKAYYKATCKRMGFSDDYLPAFNQDNVALVDTAASGIDRITETSIVVDGVEHQVDCIIFATGFELGTTWAHQAGYDVVGREGAILSEKWETGIRSYHGLFTVGFPNIFFMGLTQTGTTICVPHMLSKQVEHIAHVVEKSLERGITSVEATPDVEQEWVDVIAGKSELRRPGQIECTPGYFNAEGKPNDTRSAIGSGIFFPSIEFFDMLADWRAADDFPGLVTTT